ncbi:MAG: glutaminyl-peptide cyclotransferase [Pseudomonadales bacterium]
MRRTLLFALALLLPLSVFAQTASWTLLHTVPRAPQHFTQGLVFSGEQLFESTGRYGQSAVIAYDAKTLLEKKRVYLPDNVFGEGLTVLNGKLYQLSWKSQKIFIYNTQLQLLKTLPMRGEGWGLTTDGTSLIVSNGSDTLQFLDPETGNLQRKISVRDDNKAQKNINELEWLDGYILANVWLSNTVLLIDARSGEVVNRYDFTALAATQTSQENPEKNPDDVLNGLAWSPYTQTLLMTGKNWPVWFVVKITQPQH